MFGGNTVGKEYHMSVLTITKNNPVESVKEATFKEDVRNFQDELARTVVKE